MYIPRVTDFWTSYFQKLIYLHLILFKIILVYRMSQNFWDIELPRIVEVGISRLDPKCAPILLKKNMTSGMVSIKFIELGF